MNLVKQIMDSFSGPAVDELSSLLGADTEATERAATAAVPSLLSALAGMASTNDGANKLTNVLGSLDVNNLSNVTQMLTGDAGSLLNKGTTLLGSLFSNNMLSGLATSLSRFSGLSASVVKSLLAYLSPLVLGKVASQWKSQGGGVQTLKNLFAEQRDNISRAVPAGFSLADIPDLSPKPYVPGRAAPVEHAPAKSIASWAVPLALALLGAFLLWQFLQPRAEDVAERQPPATRDEVVTMKPAIPDASATTATLNRLRDDVGGLFTSLDTTFDDIQDAAAAERALPALNELNAKIEALNERFSRLPEASRAIVRPAIEDQAKAFIEKANTVSSIEGIGAQIKAVIQEIVAKITRWITANAG